MDRGALNRIVFGLLVLYAFAVPWEYSLDLGEPFGNVARVLGILLLGAGLLLVLERGGIRRLGAMQWLVTGFFLYFACSAMWTVDIEATLGKMRAYFQVMMVVWLAWELIETELELRVLMAAFVAGCGVLAGLTLLDFASFGSGAVSAAEQIRFVAEGQDPNDVARFLDLGFPLAALLFAVERRRWVRALSLGYLPMGLMAVLVTASRGGFTAALVALAGAGTLLVVWRRRTALAVLGGLVLAAVAVAILLPMETLERLGTIPEQVGAGNLNDRLNIWIAGWQAFRESPWWGSGAGTFTTAARLAEGDTAHNTMMAVLVTGGLAGMAIFTAIVTWAGWAVARTRGLLRIALGSVLLVWLVTSMVGSVEENRTTWLLFAVMAVAGRQETGGRDQGSNHAASSRLARAILPQANL